MKIFKLFLSLPFFLLMILIGVINSRIHYSPSIIVSPKDSINQDLLFELQGLKYALSNNADIEMQRIYPEGYVFVNALYGIAWCNFLEEEGTAPYLDEGRLEIQTVFDKINSDRGRQVFDKELPIPYGAFYTGWSSYLLSQKLSVEKQAQRNVQEVDFFKKQCELIAAAISNHVYPSSYYKSAWPADVVLCVAALAAHDRIFSPKYREVIDSWLSKVKNKLDRKGLIPHAVHPFTGNAIEPARGSSQSLMLIFLKHIDPKFAESQFAIYKSNFIQRKLGLIGVREYPIDDFGPGDVDSGPLFLQFGSAATIVGMHTLNEYGELESAVYIRNAIEGFGFPRKVGNRKTYLFGALPMADAFIAWGHSRSNIHKSPDFLAFHVYSGLVVVLLLVPLWWIWRPKRHSSEKSLHVPW